MNCCMSKRNSYANVLKYLLFIVGYESEFFIWYIFIFFVEIGKIILKLKSWKIQLFPLHRYVHIFNGYAVSTRKDEKLNVSKCLIYDLSQYTVSNFFEKSAQFTWLCSLRDNTILRIEYCNIFFLHFESILLCNYWLVSEKYFCIS